MSGKNRRAIENAVSRQTEWLHEKNRDLMDMLFEAYEHNDDIAADVAMMAWEGTLEPFGGVYDDDVFYNPEEWHEWHDYTTPQRQTLKIEAEEEWKAEL